MIFKLVYETLITEVGQGKWCPKSISCTESKNMCIMSVCSKKTDFLNKLWAKSSPQTIIASLHPSVISCSIFAPPLHFFMYVYRYRYSRHCAYLHNTWLWTIAGIWAADWQSSSVLGFSWLVVFPSSPRGCVVDAGEWFLSPQVSNFYAAVIDGTRVPSLPRGLTMQSVRGFCDTVLNKWYLELKDKPNVLFICIQQQHRWRGSETQINSLSNLND